ncbi:MAG TPA: dockerin type I domain-containing protein [Phycisphaerales bacterium]|nr:dockerin type I domain-containing protein [Phycisphaerales bacterium]
MEEFSVNARTDAERMFPSFADGVSMQGPLATVVKGIITYADGMVNGKDYGDFNEDGQRDSADFIILSDAVMDPPGSNVRLFHRLDMNADGAVDQQDAALWSSLQS